MDKLAINLRPLQALVFIHDTKSFQKAARLSGHGQSSISMQISALERELGVQLFDRRVRPPTMTVAALSIVKSAREILALLDTIETAVSGEAVNGQLALGAVPTATLMLVPDALGWLGQRYPHVRTSVRSGLSADLIEAVAAGHLDADVVTAPPMLPAGLCLHTLFEERLVFVSMAPAVISGTFRWSGCYATCACSRSPVARRRCYGRWLPQRSWDRSCRKRA